jgi:hypothetical protein
MCICQVCLVAVLLETVLSEGQKNSSIDCFYRDRGMSECFKKIKKGKEMTEGRWHVTNMSP